MMVSYFFADHRRNGAIPDFEAAVYGFDDQATRPLDRSALPIVDEFRCLTTIAVTSPSFMFASGL